MFDIKEISKHVTVAIGALLFGSTMIISAVGPARAETTVGAPVHHSPETICYMA